MNENKSNKFQKGLDITAGLTGLATSAMQSGTEMATLPENNFQESVDDLNAQSVNMGSYDELTQLMNSTSLAKTDYTKKDILGMSGGQAAGSIISSGLSGAMQGMQSFSSPWGAFAGVGTALASALGYWSRNKKAARQSQKLNYEGAIANQNFVEKLEKNTMDIGKNTRNLELLNRAALGGPLNTYFTNGVRMITEGGSHSMNPLGGIPQGIAQDGIPNLVEEGEVIYNDYVYSARLKVPEADKEMLGLKKDKDYTFAEAAEQIQKESEERPNDAISKRNLDEMMGRLQGAQEEYKAKQQQRKFKSAVNKMTPDELSMFMQQLQQPQQMQPMMAMQSMQPMQPTQSEAPMFAKGGILGHVHATDGNLDLLLPGATSSSISDMIANAAILQQSLASKVRTEDPYNPGQTVPEIIEKKMNLEADSKDNSSTNKKNIFSIAQALRTAPVFGSLAGTISSLFDKPNYSNIERAEKRMLSVPRVAPGHIGQRMSYNPVDINYIATQQANQGIGARRALNEMGATNPAGVQQAIIANNYQNQTSLADAIMKAGQLNRQNLAQALEFNRGTDTTNIQNNLTAALQNQQMDAQKANFLLQTGQLRDAELAKVQNNRSVQLTNLFNNLGNLGTDMLNREQAGAVAASLGVTYNDLMKLAALRGLGVSVDAKGGKLNTKKGGKHA